MLGLAQAFLILAMAQGPTSVPDNFGQQALVEGRDTAAIAAIRDNQRIASDDPARLINLGIAYARQGDIALARQLFEAARNNRDRVELETAEGEWIDSRQLAHQALAMLDRGEFSASARMAAR